MLRTTPRIAVILGVGLLVWPAVGVQSSGSEAKGVSPPEGLQPGAVYVFFDDEGFQRPGTHGPEEQIRSHGAVTEIHNYGVERQIGLAIEGINGFSKLWMGQIRFPTAGEVTFLAEVDDGMRLFVGGTSIIDGWAR